MSAALTVSEADARACPGLRVIYDRQFARWCWLTPPEVEAYVERVAQFDRNSRRLALQEQLADSDALVQMLSTELAERERLDRALAEMERAA